MLTCAVTGLPGLGLRACGGADTGDAPACRYPDVGPVLRIAPCALNPAGREARLDDFGACVQVHAGVAHVGHAELPAHQRQQRDRGARLLPGRGGDKEQGQGVGTVQGPEAGLG